MSDALSVKGRQSGVTTESQTSPHVSKASPPMSPIRTQPRVMRSASGIVFILLIVLSANHALYGMRRRGSCSGCAESLPSCLQRAGGSTAQPSRHHCCWLGLLAVGCWLPLPAGRLEVKGKWLELRSSATLGSQLLDSLALCTTAATVAANVSCL